MYVCTYVHMYVIIPMHIMCHGKHDIKLRTYVITAHLLLTTYECRAMILQLFYNEFEITSIELR